MNPKVSIVIPTYSNSKGVFECLDSIVRQTDLDNLSIIVVANGAPEATGRIAEIYREYPVKLIWLPEPCGYTIATNVGIKTAMAEGAEFIVLMNDDFLCTEHPKNSWLNMLLAPFLEDAKVGVTGPVRNYCYAAERSFLIFFCVMIRTAMLEEIGILDEIFSPGSGEDTDLCCRAEDNGWKIRQVPSEDPTQLVDKGCEDLPEWKRLKMHTSTFPGYHDGNATFSKIPEIYEPAMAKNHAILKERYGGRVNTPTNLCARCGGPTVDGICVGTPEAPSCTGLTLWRAAVVDGWFGADEGCWLAEQVSKLPEGAKVLEVGSWHGRSSRFIADNLPEHGQVWCVDTFIGSSGEPEMHGSAHYDRGDHAFQWWWCNLQEHIESGTCVPVRMHSDNAAHTISHLIDKGQMEKFDLIFLDGDHSEEGIKTDVESWLPLLKEGGLICGHDYYKEYEGPHWVHVRQYVEAKFPNVEKSATSIWHVRPHWPTSTEFADMLNNAPVWISAKGQGGSHVYDCFPFNNELDLLELRFNELDEVVDRWVITEATLTHGGQPKPLYLAESIDREPERWARWLPRITHLIVEDFNHVKDVTGSDLHWAIERHQRESIMRGLEGCNDNDIILISDVDEIPRASALSSYSTTMGLCALEMTLYYGSMNCQGLEPWTWTRVLPYSTLKTMSPCAVRYNWGFDQPNYSQTIKDAGWHFSFLGGPDAWVKKLEDTPHQEYNVAEFKDRQVLKQRVLSGQDMLGRDIPYRLVEVDDTFPRFVLDNQQRFEENQFIMHAEANDFIAQVKAEYPDYFANKSVLEVGSLNINGSVRQYFTDCFYHGIDLGAGPDVDEVIHVTKLPDGLAFDVVISTEALEHDSQWQASLRKMYALLKPNGLMVVTCAGPQRAEHGTTKTDTYSSPFTTDYYRNITVSDFQGALPLAESWSDAELMYGRRGEDVWFRGVKKAAVTEPVVEQPATVLPFQQSLARKKHWTVTAEVSTKDRYTTTLPLTLSAIINQTHPPDKLTIYDDGEHRVSAEQLSEMSPFSGLLKLATDKKIEWVVMHTPRQGQVANHQHCLDTADTDYIWRVDDDEIPAGNCLEVLLNTIRDYGTGGEFEKIGAVGGLVHNPGAVSPLPRGVDGSLGDIGKGLNLSWFSWNSGPREVEHLYSTFLFRVSAAKDAGGYPTGLSVVGHREESWFTNKLHRAGYKVVCTPHTVTHHLHEATGGIRSFSDNSLWESDEQKWQGYLRAAGVVLPESKMIVCDFGLGDHLILKGIWPELRRKFPERKWTMALCYPEVFKDEDVTIISIADAKLLLGSSYDNYSAYKYAWENNFVRPMPEVMLEFFSR